MWIAILILIIARPFIASLVFTKIDFWYSFLFISINLFWLFYKRNLLKKQPLYFATILFLIITAASIFSSYDTLNSLGELYKYILVITGFFVISVAKDQKEKLIFTFSLLAGLISIYSIYQLTFGTWNLLRYLQKEHIVNLFVQEIISRYRAFQPFILPTVLGSFLITMLPIALVNYLEERKSASRWKRLFLFSMPSLIFIALILSKSFGAILSLTLALIIYISIKAFKGRLNKKLILILALVVLSAIAVFLIRSYKALEFTSLGFSFQRRLFYFKQALEIIAEHPIRGVGIAGFPFYVTKYTHNVFLQVWVEAGVFGLISFLALVIISFKNGLKIINTTLGKGLFIGYLAFLIHNLIDISFYLPEASFFWWAILGLMISFGSKEKN